MFYSNFHIQGTLLSMVPRKGHKTDGYLLSEVLTFRVAWFMYMRYTQE